jgi:hypothetical protein
MIAACQLTSPSARAPVLGKDRMVPFREVARVLIRRHSTRQ